MKTRKVLNLRTHLGGWKGMTSYDHQKNGAEMELVPSGVAITKLKNEPILYDGVECCILEFNANCIEAIVSLDVAEDDVKRGPGRPPGPRAV